VNVAPGLGCGMIAHLMSKHFSGHAAAPARLVLLQYGGGGEGDGQGGHFLSKRQI
jgi:hypothetical protein